MTCQLSVRSFIIMEKDSWFKKPLTVQGKLQLPPYLIGSDHRIGETVKRLLFFCGCFFLWRSGGSEGAGGLGGNGIQLKMVLLWYFYDKEWYPRVLRRQVVFVCFATVVNTTNRWHPSTNPEILINDIKKDVLLLNC